VYHRPYKLAVKSVLRGTSHTQVSVSDSRAAWIDALKASHRLVETKLSSSNPKRLR